jgi:hypothetical protein
LGPNYKGDNIYEFIFSETLEVFGENWESKPANGYPSPPDLEYIKKVGTLVNEDVEFDLVQNSDVFSVIDSMDGVLALGWEKETDEIDFSLVKRLVFQFGESEESVKNKLYERDIVLQFEKELSYEK